MSIVDRRHFLTYAGGTALGVFAFDEFSNKKAIAAPVPGGK
jgi:hypothetical protein